MSWPPMSACSGHRSIRPVPGKRWRRHACPPSSSGCCGVPRFEKYAGAPTHSSRVLPRLRACSLESAGLPVRTTASKPSSMTSTRRSLKCRSSSTAGKRRANAESTGSISPLTSGRLTFRRPLGAAWASVSSRSAAATSVMMRRQRSRNCSPSAVRLTLRVLRFRRRAPRRSSSRAMVLLAAEGVMPRCRAAAAKLRASATRTKMLRPAKLSIGGH